MANSTGPEFTSTLNEFKADGTIVSGNLVYGDSQCAGTVLRAEPTSIGTYSATATTVELKASMRGQSFQLISDYQINGDVLMLTNLRAFVDGLAVEPSEPSLAMKRVP